MKSQEIIEIVFDYFQIDVSEAKSKSRGGNLNHCRQVAMYFLMRMTSYSSGHIGMLFDRDHATVLHGRKCVKEQMLNNKVYGREIKEIEEMLNPIRLDHAEEVFMECDFFSDNNLTPEAPPSDYSFERPFANHSFRNTYLLCKH